MRKGFTLAEVLITLAIIGIVSALTIPTLINNYRKKQYVVGLQKAISVLNNGIRLMMVDEGVNELKHTNFYKCSGGVAVSDTQRKCMNEYLAKYIKITDYAKSSGDKNIYYDTFPTSIYGKNESANYFLGMLAFYVFRTSNSMVIWPLPNSAIAGAVVDVNGKMAPNQFGRDIFVLNRSDSGYYSVCGSGGGWNDSSDTKNYCGDDMTIASDAFGCSGRIFDEGWKMNY